MKTPRRLIGNYAHQKRNVAVHNHCRFQFMSFTGHSVLMSASEACYEALLRDMSIGGFFSERADLLG